MDSIHCLCDYGSMYEDELRDYIGAAAARISMVVDPLAFLPRQGDMFHVEVSDRQVQVIGSSSSALSYGMYRYLESIGFAFPCPGVEVCPPSFELADATLDGKAALDWKVLAADGPSSFASYIAFADWAHKHGFNALGLSHIKPYGSFMRWYSHCDNPMLKGDGHELPTRQAVYEFSDQVLPSYCMETGLGLAGGGRGFEERGLGWSSEDWPQMKDKPATALSWADEATRSAFVSSVVGYAMTHPGLELVHVWLPEGVGDDAGLGLLLSQLDKALSAAHLDVEVAVKPPRGSSVPSGRFIPIAHDAVEGGLLFIDDYAPSRLPDFAEYTTAKAVHEAVSKAKEQGAAGVLSHHDIRSFMGIGLGAHVLSRTLWEDLSFDQVVDDYLIQLFGDEGPEVGRILESVSSLAAAGSFDEASRAADDGRLYLKGHLGEGVLRDRLVFSLDAAVSVYGIEDLKRNGTRLEVLSLAGRFIDGLWQREQRFKGVMDFSSLYDWLEGV